MQITISHIYYNQIQMLQLQKQAWMAHPYGHVKYTLIDDGSSIPIGADYAGANVDVYRIHEDIPWNPAGARNLAFHVAKTDWVFCADMDHVVTSRALIAMLDLPLDDANIVYTFARLRNDGYYGVLGTHNILMNRRRFFEIGGNDEDFSGNYASEDTFFGDLLAFHKVHIVYCSNIVFDWFPRVGATKNLSRDRAFNINVMTHKWKALHEGRDINGPILRFEWSAVQDGHP